MAQQSEKQNNNGSITNMRTEDAYNTFYTPQGDDISPYDKLYRRPLELHHRIIIQQILNSADKAIKENPDNPRKIRLLDYGCGSGRYRKSAQDAAQFIKEQGYNVPIEVVGCDISSNGLKRFEESLKKEGFEGQNGNLSKDNLTFSLLKITEDMWLKEVAEHIGKVDNAYSPFGPIGYIRTREGRQDMMKMLSDITTNQLFFTLPGQNHMRPEQEEAAKRRQQGLEPIAKNDGDIVYSRAGGKVKLFFHIYQGMKEVQDDLEKAGINGKISMSNIEHEDALTSTPQQEAMDFIACYYLNSVAPQVVKDAASKYYMVSASKEKEMRRVPEKDSLEYKYQQSLKKQNTLLL